MTAWIRKSSVIRRIYPSYQGPSQLSIEYKRVNGFAPDLQRPRLLSERILHRILFDRDPLLHTFCDKVASKEWINERIGPGHTPRTLALASSVAGAFCFRGRVRGLRIFRADSSLAVHRSNQASLPRTKECFLDENFNPLPLVRPQHDHLPSLVPADRHELKAIKELAQAISAGTSFLRVDSYLSDVGIRLGEITPYPGAGICLRMPRQWDAWFGAFWD